jgi:hypothetical protein
VQLGVTGQLCLQFLYIRGCQGRWLKTTGKKKKNTRIIKYCAEDVKQYLKQTRKEW